MWSPKEPGLIGTTSTPPIMAMGWRQCLPLSVVQLKGKHCQKPNCRNGVVDIVPINPGSFGDLPCLFPGQFLRQYMWQYIERDVKLLSIL